MIMVVTKVDRHRVPYEVLQVKGKMDSVELAPHAAFGKRLAQIRAEMGLTRREFAELVRVSTKSIYRYEHGYQLPGTEEMMKLAEVCAGRIEWLLIERDLTLMQQLAAALVPLSPEAQASVMQYAHLLRAGTSPLVQAIATLVAATTLSEQLHQDDPA